MTSHKEETVRLHGLKESMCGWENRFRSEFTAGEKVDFRQRTWGRIQLYDIFSPRGLHISVVLILFGIDSPFFFFFFFFIHGLLTCLFLSTPSLERGQYHVEGKWNLPTFQLCFLCALVK